MLKLITEQKFNIIGRGEVYTIELKKNNISPLRHEFGKLMGQNVLIDDQEQIYKIIGIESFALGLEAEHAKIGILVKQKDVVVKFGKLLNLHSADTSKLNT